MSSCGMLSADISEIDVPCINLEKADIVVIVLVKNPNPFPISLIDMNFMVESDGRNLLSGSTRAASRTIPAYGEETVKIPLTLIFADIKKTYDQIKPGSIIPYKIMVELIFDVPIIGRFTITLEKSGEIPIPRMPNVDLEKIRFQRFSFEETVAIHYLKLENMNDFDMGLNAMDCEIWLSNVSIGGAELSKPTKIKKNGFGSIELSITFSPKDLGPALWNMMRENKIGYTLKGNVQVDTPFGPMKLPFIKEGGTTILEHNKGNDEE